MSIAHLKSISVVVIIFVLTCGHLFAQLMPSDPETKALLLAYKSRVSKDVETPLSQAREKLSQNYIQALERLQQETTLRGKLEEAEAFKIEKEAVAASNSQNLPVLQPSLRELASLRRQYIDAMQALRTNMQRKLEPLQRELVRQLDALSIKLARSGKTDAALEAKQIAKTYLEQKGQIGFEGDWEDHTQKLAPKTKGSPIVLKRLEILSTEASFKPPVEIELVVKVEGLDLRLGYAANQLIFNWELRPTELRVDGGPANKIYTPMQGEIPKGKFVVIRWQVDKDKQVISVDGKQRFEHRGNYSEIDRPFSVQAFGSEATVESIRIRRPTAL